MFTGDTLFIGGCGRFFEGNGEEMLANMDLISKMDPDTNIFCGHEYTVSNLEWAAELDNSILPRLNWAREKRLKKEFTIPSTVSDEIKYNVFMKCRN